MSENSFGFDEDLLAIERGLDLLFEDPMAMFKTTSPGQRLFIENLANRIYLHAANKWGKTTIVVACALALAQGRRELNGIALPRLPSPNVGALFSLDYKQQRLSVQETLTRMLGRWPHKAEWDGPTLISLLVKPGFGPGFWASAEAGENVRDWSKMGLYSQKNLQSGTGFRLHYAGFDEPPVMSVYREVLKAGFPGWPFPTFIGATSLKRSQWYPLRSYFPLESEGKLVNGVIRIQGSVYDNAALTAADLADLELRYAPDPDRLARLYGQELNTEGSSPFRTQIEELRKWMEAAVPGQMREWKVSREVTTNEGKQLVEQVVEVEFWEDYDLKDRYRVIADPSLGIDDGLHDPGEVTVCNMTKRRIAARFNGYIGEYGLGVLSAGLAKHFGDAMVDPETGGGYGSGFLSAMRAMKYGRFVNNASGRQEMDRTRIGFTINTDTRMEFAAALNEALLASSQGHPWVTIQSAGMIADLIDLIVDEKGKPITPPGTHDEGFVIAGRLATLLAPDRKVALVAPKQDKRVLTIRERGMRAYYAQLGLPMPGRERARPRMRPRFRSFGS